VQSVFFVADNHGVAGVVATVELDYIVNVLCQKVGSFAFTLVTPLGADNHNCRNDFPLKTMDWHANAYS
jgi:hypothetical protein